MIFLEADILFADYWKTGYYAHMFCVSRTVQDLNILLHCLIEPIKMPLEFYCLGIEHVS